MLWGFGSFVVFAVLMRYFLFPRLRKGMDARYCAIRAATSRPSRSPTPPVSDVAQLRGAAGGDPGRGAAAHRGRPGDARGRARRAAGRGQRPHRREAGRGRHRGRAGPAGRPGRRRERRRGPSPPGPASWRPAGRPDPQRRRRRRRRGDERGGAADDRLPSPTVPASPVGGGAADRRQGLHHVAPLALARAGRADLRHAGLGHHLLPAGLEGRSAGQEGVHRPHGRGPGASSTTRRRRRPTPRPRPPASARRSVTSRASGSACSPRPTPRPRRCSPTAGPVSTPRSPSSRPKADADIAAAGGRPTDELRTEIARLGVGRRRRVVERVARRRHAAAPHRGLHPTSRQPAAVSQPTTTPHRRLRPGLFEVARAEGTLDEVEDELFRFARSYESSEELRNTLTDEQIPPAKRQAIVEDLLGGKATPTTVQLVSMVVGSGRGRDLPAIIDRIVQRAASSKNLEVAEVRSRRRAHRRPAGPPQGGAGQRHRQERQPQGRRRPLRARRPRGHRRRHRHRRHRPHAPRPAEDRL